MGTNLADREGYVTDRLLDYYEERAKGGVGLVIVGGTTVEPSGRPFQTCLSLYRDDCIPGFRRLSDKIRLHGARAFVQLIHGGRECSPQITGLRPVAPSPLPPLRARLADKTIGEKPRVLSIEEVEEMIEMSMGK